jgi:hypothetical protein
MKPKKIFMHIFLLLFTASFLCAAPETDGSFQKEENIKLAPRYRAFLAETQTIMSSKEREKFLKLETNRQRDKFIKTFWNARKGLRDNVSTLFLLRMTQVLDLSNEQAANIYPEVIRVEREKRDINRSIGIQLRKLRSLLHEEMPDENELAQIVKELRELRYRLKGKDEELEIFLAENLTLVQQAKYILFAQDFFRGLKEKLERARRSIK